MQFWIMSGMELLVDKQDEQGIFSAILQSLQQRPFILLKAFPLARYTEAHSACHSPQTAIKRVLVRRWRELGKGSSRHGKFSSLDGSAVSELMHGVTVFYDPHTRTGEAFDIRQWWFRDPV